MATTPRLAETAIAIARTCTFYDEDLDAAPILAPSADADGSGGSTDGCDADTVGPDGTACTCVAVARIDALVGIEATVLFSESDVHTLVASGVSRV